MHRTSQYLLVCASLTFGGMGAAALFNYLVDPYGIYRAIDLPGINANKPGEHGHDRMVKAHAIARIKPNGIILGNSRVQYGMNPDDAILRPYANKVYNGGLLNSDIYLVLRYMQHAHAVAPLHLVLVGLDPLMFDQGAPSAREDFFEGRLAVTVDGQPARSLVPIDFAPTLLSSDALRLSAQTLLRQSSVASDLLANGQRSAAVLQQYFRGAHGTHFEFLFVEAEYLQAYRKAQFMDENSNSPTLETLRQIIIFARQHHIDLRLFITPNHARLNEVARLAGKAADIERWKRALVRLLDEENRRGAAGKTVELWDFNATARFVTETVPPANDADAEAYDWWETTHFREHVGHAMFARIFDAPDQIADFGVRLTPDNIDQELARMRVLQQTYARSHPDDVAEIEREAAQQKPAADLHFRLKAAL